MSGAPRAPIYDGCVKERLCYNYQCGKCNNQEASYCQNGKHLCYYCWINGYEAQHACYTKEQGVCEFRSKNFQHLPQRDDRQYENSVPAAINYGPRTDRSYQSTSRDGAGVNHTEPTRVQRNVHYQPHREQIEQNFSTNGASREPFVVGEFNHQRPMYGGYNTVDTSLAKRRRSDDTGAEDKEDLRIKIVQLECDLKLEKEKLAMKEESRQNEKLILETMNKNLENKKEELEKKNKDYEKIIHERSLELEMKTKEICDLQKSQDELRDECVKERQSLTSQIMDHKQQINNLRNQIYQLGKVKGMPTGANMNGQIVGSASRNLVPNITCNYMGCVARFNQLEKSNGTTERHLYEAHGVGQNLVNPGFNNGPSGSRSSTRPPLLNNSSGSRSNTFNASGPHLARTNGHLW